MPVTHVKYKKGFVEKNDALRVAEDLYNSEIPDAIRHLLDNPDLEPSVRVQLVEVDPEESFGMAPFEVFIRLQGQEWKGAENELRKRLADMLSEWLVRHDNLKDPHLKIQFCAVRIEAIDADLSTAMIPTQD